MIDPDAPATVRAAADGTDRGGQVGARAATWRRNLPFEIISVDSAQVYRGMDIGTAKPDRATRARDPASSDRHSRSERRTTRRASSCAMRARPCRQIWRRGRQPLLVGGTMLYFHALTQGLAELPEADLRVRAADRCAGGRRRVGGGARELERVDPRRRREFTSTIRSASSGRSRCTGSPASPSARLQQIAQVRARRRARCSELRSRRSSEPFCIARIEARFVAMLAAGLLEEVRALCAKEAI